MAVLEGTMLHNSKSFDLCNTALDGGGVVGLFLVYGLMIALCASALLVFVHLWRRGRLDMDEEPKYRMLETEDPALYNYSGGLIREFKDTRVPAWLKWVYVVLPIWGIVWAFLYWGGSMGWLDRGRWFQLEEAADTTAPYWKPDQAPDPARDSPYTRPL